MRLLQDIYFSQYKSLLNIDLQKEFAKLKEIEISPRNFSFYTSVSAMSSAKIEGEKLDIDSFVKHKLLDIEYLPELTEKPNDLYSAYIFAKENDLNFDNFMSAHALIAAHLLPENQRGRVRRTEMLVIDNNTGKIVYEAASMYKIEHLVELFFEEIDKLLNSKNNLSIQEIFYYAALIHLVFVNIHPFADGNGRTARLLEKWFLAQKLGEQAWFIQSEKYYYNNRDIYYKNLAKLGLFYDELKYENSLPFLLMLAESFNLETIK